MKRIKALILTMILVFGMAAITSYAEGYVFSDTENHWAKDYIWPLALKGIINGKTETTFEPDSHITRAEFVTLVIKAGQIPLGAGPSYVDVAEGSWYAKVIVTAKDNEYISSNMVSNGFFFPNQNITREEMTSIIIRLYEKERVTLNDGGVEKFIDCQEIADWAKEYVGKAAEAGLVTGGPDGKFSPKGNATRAEAAVIVSRFINLLDTGKVEMVGCYKGTQAPDYGVIMGAPVKRIDASASGTPVFVYDDGRKGLNPEVLEYVSYLKENGWVTNVDTMNGRSRFWVFWKGRNVLMASFVAETGEVHIVP